MLKGSQGITQPKQYNFILIYTIISREYSKLFKARLYLYIVESIDNIKFREDSSIIKLGQSLTEEQDRVAIFNSNIIKLVVINTDLEASTRLYNNKKVIIGQGASMFNKIAYLILFNIAFNSSNLLSRERARLNIRQVSSRQKLNFVIKLAILQQLLYSISIKGRKVVSIFFKLI